MHLHQGGIRQEDLGLGGGEALAALQVARKGPEGARPLGGFHRLGHAEQEAPILGAVLEEGVQHEDAGPRYRAARPPADVGLGLWGTAQGAGR